MKPARSDCDIGKEGPKTYDRAKDRHSVFIEPFKSLRGGNDRAVPAR